MTAIHKLLIYMLLLSSSVSGGGYLAPLLPLFSLGVSRRNFDDCFDKFHVILFTSAACLHVASTIISTLSLSLFPADSSSLFSGGAAVWLQLLLGAPPVRSKEWAFISGFRLLPSLLIIILVRFYKVLGLTMGIASHQNKKGSAIEKKCARYFFTLRQCYAFWFCSSLTTAILQPSCLGASLLIATSVVLSNQALPELLALKLCKPWRERHLYNELYFIQCALTVVLVVMGLAQNDGVFWLLQKLLGEGNTSFIGLFQVFRPGGGVAWRPVAQLLGMITCTWLTEALAVKGHCYTCDEQKTAHYSTPHSGSSHATRKEPQHSPATQPLKPLGWRAQLFAGCCATNLAFFPSIPSLCFVIRNVGVINGVSGLESTTENTVWSGVFVSTGMSVAQHLAEAAARCSLLPPNHWALRIFMSDLDHNGWRAAQLATNAGLLLWMLAVSVWATEKSSEPTVAAREGKGCQANSSRQPTGHPSPAEQQQTPASKSAESLSRQPEHTTHHYDMNRFWMTVSTSLLRPLMLCTMLALVAYHNIRRQSLDVLHGLLLLLVVVDAFLPHLLQRHPRIPLFCVNVLIGALLLAQFFPIFDDSAALIPLTPVRLHTLGPCRLRKRWDYLPYLAAQCVLRGILFLSTHRLKTQSTPSPCGLLWFLFAIMLSAAMQFLGPRSILHDMALLLSVAVGIAFVMRRKLAAKRVIRMATIFTTAACIGVATAAIPQLRDLLLDKLLRKLPGCETEELAHACGRELFGFVGVSAGRGLGLALAIVYWHVLLVLLLSKFEPACKLIDDEAPVFDLAMLCDEVAPQKGSLVWNFFKKVTHPNGGLRVLSLVSRTLGQAALGIVALRHPNLLNAGYVVFLLMDGLTYSFLPVYMGIHTCVWLGYQLHWVPMITATVPDFIAQGPGIRLETLLGLSKYPLTSGWNSMERADTLLPLLFLALCVILHHATLPYDPYQFLHYHFDGYYTPRWWGFFSIQFLPNIGFELLALALLLAVHYTLSSVLSIGFAAGITLICVAGRALLVQHPVWLHALRLLLTLNFSWVAVVRLREAMRGASTQEFVAGNKESAPWRWWLWTSCGSLRAALSGSACLIGLLDYRRAMHVVEHRMNLEAMHHDGYANFIDFLRAQNVQDILHLTRKQFERIVPEFPYKESCAAQLMQPFLFVFPALYPLLICSCLLIVSSPPSFLSLAVAAGSLLYAEHVEPLHLAFFNSWRKIAPLSGVLLLAPLLSNVAGMKGWLATHVPNLAFFIGLLQRTPGLMEEIRPASFTIVHVVLLFCVILQTRVYSEFQYSSVMRKLYFAAKNNSK